MRVSHGITARDRMGKGVAAAVVLACLAALVAWGGVHGRVGAQTHPALAASILSYDGKDFVRTQTTLMTEDGKSAANTKLDHSSPAYQALVKKHSYVGEVTAFGKKYDADYAPLTSDDGKLTGALFVGVEK